ncbi:Nucleoside diphosphate kinase-like domain [Dillenia turbinata]|uniref:Nucleoside diphosphate kinase-like domain n=1 Tax=Dillenia turbinata TaxID=194707 RepID=A0AAN8UD88_9MAGN
MKSIWREIERTLESWGGVDLRQDFNAKLIEKETTLGMIEPDGLLGNYTDLIKKIIQESGFGILGELMVQLDEDSVRSFYAEHSLKSFFPCVVKYMTSIRAFCGMNSERNCVHVSDSPQSAAWEISFFFLEISLGKFLFPV